MTTETGGVPRSPEGCPADFTAPILPGDQPAAGTGPALRAPNRLVLKSGSPIPAANAALAAPEVSIGQSMPSSYFSNQSSAPTFGYSVATELSASSIQALLEPPLSLEPTSAIARGLGGPPLRSDPPRGMAGAWRAPGSW